MRGLFISIEGVEGVGKSTNQRYVADLVAASGYEVVMTREPGGTTEAEAIRALLLDNQYSLLPVSEVLLMFASRSEHVTKVIKPALAQGKCVVSDRFVDASYAYQGGGRKLGAETVSILENMVLGDLRPDLTLLLDLDVDIGLARLDKRSEKDRIEQESSQFFKSVRDAYLERVKQHPDRFAILDASGSVADVQLQIKNSVERLLAGG